MPSKAYTAPRPSWPGAPTHSRSPSRATAEPNEAPEDPSKGFRRPLRSIDHRPISQTGSWHPAAIDSRSSNEDTPRSPLDRGPEKRAPFALDGQLGLEGKGVVGRAVHVDDAGVVCSGGGSDTKMRPSTTAMSDPKRLRPDPAGGVRALPIAARSRPRGGRRGLGEIPGHERTQPRPPRARRPGPWPSRRRPLPHTRPLQSPLGDPGAAALGIHMDRARSRRGIQGRDQHSVPRARPSPTRSRPRLPAPDYRGLLPAIVADALIDVHRPGRRPEQVFSDQELIPGNRHGLSEALGRKGAPGTTAWPRPTPIPSRARFMLTFLLGLVRTREGGVDSTGDYADTCGAAGQGASYGRSESRGQLREVILDDSQTPSVRTRVS